MPCPICGDVCRCSSDANVAVTPRWLADAAPTATELDAEMKMPREDTESLPSEEAGVHAESSEAPEEDSSVWRQEVAARLNRYQARRKPRPPRYPSLRLRFEQEEPAGAATGTSTDSQFFPQRMASNQALALNSFVASATPAEEIPSQAPAPQVEASQQTAFIAPPTAKIIEFPRSWTPEPASLDELAEAVMDRPRILEVPEVAPTAPAMGGITIEPAERPDFEKRPGIDIPLQSAPVAQRIFAAAIDGVVISMAWVLFGFIFWKVTAIQPPRIQILGIAAGLAMVLWGAYQYLLVVHSGSTPGLRLARLELARFDGSPAGRRVRRWRVVASFLSAASLGMGYAWVFLDEDSLCWHDRITQTYLAPRP
jgi:uncharacterized RDD family membrane protein YckC